MKPGFGHRAFSAVLLGMLLGSFVHHDQLRWAQRGRDAFLANQAHRFDHTMAAPHPMIVTLIAATIVVVGAIAVYEIVALVLCRIVGNPSGDQIAR